MPLGMLCAFIGTGVRTRVPTMFMLDFPTMKISIVKDGWPWIFGSILFPGVLALCATRSDASAWGGVLWAVATILGGFMVYFFRDPEREIASAVNEIVAGADGTVRAIEHVKEPRFLQGDAVRVSVFLSPFNVHVNRAPLAGTVAGLDYTPGRHILTMKNEASEYNEHSSIYIEGEKTRCLVKQIVGPLVRRVVYWLEPGQPIGKGERIGMMKFGSRMDMYFPVTDVEICVAKGDDVVAGQTILARVREDIG